MFYAPYGKGGKALGGTPAAGAHIDEPHLGAIPLGPYTYVPVVHAGPSFAGPAHIDFPHAAYGPFIHGGPEGGEALPFGKPYGFGRGLGKGFGKGLGKGFARPPGIGKTGYGKPFGFGKAGVGKAGFGKPVSYGYLGLYDK